MHNGDAKQTKNNERLHFEYCHDLIRLAVGRTIDSIRWMSLYIYWVHLVQLSNNYDSQKQKLECTYNFWFLCTHHGAFKNKISFDFIFGKQRTKILVSFSQINVIYPESNAINFKWFLVITWLPKTSFEHWQHSHSKIRSFFSNCLILHQNVMNQPTDKRRISTLYTLPISLFVIVGRSVFVKVHFSSYVVMLIFLI